MARLLELIDKTFTNFQPISNDKKETIISQINIVNELRKHNELLIEFQSSYKEYLVLVDRNNMIKDSDIVLGIENYKRATI